VPVVVIAPALVTLRPVLEAVVMKVTNPVAFETVRDPIVNEEEAAGVVAPEMGDVCLSEPPEDEPPPPPEGLITVRVYVQVPVSPRESESVPETV
jgi:hypothetical protein